MPKAKNSAKETKQKLSKEERSQIAKDRWAKRRETVAMQDNPGPVKERVDEAVKDGILTPAPIDELLDDSVAKSPEGSDRVDIVSEQGNVLASRENKSEQDDNTPSPLPVTVPAPQLTPAPPKKQKRYTGPKEFSVALKAAESRLAKAINERAEAMGKLAGLNAEIPSLLGIINALKGSQNPIPSISYDFSGGVQNAFQAPIPQQFQQPMNLLQAIQNAQPAPPISRASGGTMQLGPDVVGSLEGPDDDDNPDKFITGPAAGNKGWI